jgi:hypothetical protein
MASVEMDDVAVASRAADEARRKLGGNGLDDGEAGADRAVRPGLA